MRGGTVEELDFICLCWKSQCILKREGKHLKKTRVESDFLKERGLEVWAGLVQGSAVFIMNLMVFFKATLVHYFNEKTK